jgi:hypothetical protein
MKPQTDLDNLINDIFLTSGGTLGLPARELRGRAEQIIILYKHADADANQTKQQIIDAVILELCGRSLRDILKKYEEPGDLKHVGQSGETPSL